MWYFHRVLRPFALQDVSLTSSSLSPSLLRRQQDPHLITHTHTPMCAPVSVCVLGVVTVKWYFTLHQSNNSLIKSWVPDQEASFYLAGCQPTCANTHTHTHTHMDDTHSLVSSFVRDTYMLINNGLSTFSEQLLLWRSLEATLVQGKIKCRRGRWPVFVLVQFVFYMKKHEYMHVLCTLM